MFNRAWLSLPLLGASLLVGCGGGYGYGYGGYVRTPPPPVRYEAYGRPPSPGYVWVNGYWGYRSNNYYWVNGRWARPPRPHMRWESGRWEQNRNGWRYRDGRWR
jgi:hypothetical protein